MLTEKYLKDAPSSRGKTLLLKHLRGEKLTRGEAILAQCCMCMGFYIDGRVPCTDKSCPLYPFMPYTKR